MAFRVLVLLAMLWNARAELCPSGQRYDVGSFPPRCIDCPAVVPNRVPLSQVSAQVRNRRAPKFSPGLPQNDTCGCWRANQTVEVALNASWIVSGLLFGSSRGRWLREIAVEASDDNVTFLAWGRYAFRNFTDASLALFAQPIRARVFRVTITRYVNHYINTSGYPLTAAALVSQTQPFGCSCPMLPSGECCPFVNMTVRNGTCVWCMDPALITTVVVDGCGRCRQGTFEHEGRCIMRRMVNAANRLAISDVRWDGLTWSAKLRLDTDGRSQAALFLLPCSACPDRLPLDAGSQYLQFDRGRYNLSLPQQILRQWTRCTETVCTGELVAVFQGVDTQTVRQPIRVDMRIPAWSATLAPVPSLALARAELHTFTGTWAIRIVGVALDGQVHLAWDGAAFRTYNATDFILVDPPPERHDCLRITSGAVRLAAYAPFKVVVHGAQTAAQLGGVSVRFAYGLGMRDRPTPGDSELLVSIMAWSPQPIRLKRLATTFGALSVLYTTPKGFIIDPSRVLDLSVACAQGNPSVLYSWIMQAVSLLPDQPNEVRTLVANACLQLSLGAVSKMYWLVPTHTAAGRNEAFGVQVLAEFA